MIGKVAKPGKNFTGLVRYLLHGSSTDQDPVNKTTRVAWTATRQLFSDRPEQAPLVMRMTARASRRVQHPVYHFVISWRPDEEIAASQMQQVVDTACADLGLEPYQRLYIAHHDTPHPHVHVVANRIHPETGRAWKGSHDFRRLELSLARQALILGLEVVQGRHNQRLDVSSPRRPRDPDWQRARREGATARHRMSAERIAELRLELRSLFLHAPNWTAINAALTEKGLALAAKGQGLVIADPVSEMKLSDLGVGIRLPLLEKRLGAAWSPSPDAELVSRRQRPRTRTSPQP